MRDSHGHAIRQIVEIKYLFALCSFEFNYISSHTRRHDLRAVSQFFYHFAGLNFQPCFFRRCCGNEIVRSARIEVSYTYCLRKDEIVAYTIFNLIPQTDARQSDWAFIVCWKSPLLPASLLFWGTRPFDMLVSMFTFVSNSLVFSAIKTVVVLTISYALSPSARKVTHRSWHTSSQPFSYQTLSYFFI